MTTSVTTSLNIYGSNGLDTYVGWLLVSGIFYQSSLLFYESPFDLKNSSPYSILSFILLISAYITYTIQQFFIFRPENHQTPPSKDKWLGPTDTKNGGYQEDVISTKDNVSFNGLWMPMSALKRLNMDPYIEQSPKNQNTPIVIYFHGNSGNAAGYVHIAEEICLKVEANVFLTDYRGYGASNYPYRPDEQGIILDAIAAFTHVSEKYRNDNVPIILWGHSLGCFPVFYLAYLFPDSINSIILDSPFSTLPSLVAGFLPFPFKWISFAISNLFPNNVLCTLISKFEAPMPVLIMATDKDYLISHKKHSIPLFKILTNGDAHMSPMQFSDKYAKASPYFDMNYYEDSESRKTLCLFNNGSHDFLYKENNYFKIVKDFISAQSYNNNYSKNIQPDVLKQDIYYNCLPYVKKNALVVFILCSVVGSLILRYIIR